VSKHNTFDRDYFEGEQSHFKGGYELLIRLNRWRLKKFHKIIKFYTKDFNQKTLLDIGCACGHFLDILKQDFEVYGTDISEFGVKVTKIKVKCPVEKGNCEEGLPFNRKFEIVTAIDIIEHLHHPKKALQNIYNSLSEGGYLFFEVPTINDKISQLVYDLFFARDKTHIFIKSVDEITEFVESVGFKKVAIYSSLLPIFTKKESFVSAFSAIFGVFKKGKVPAKLY